ncbi:MAG: pyridoxal phosphate-dependent aminotransferase [Clostridiales bacterium]|nr:pyridoxal phosphate-dependent aminotransferase [Clostridiales bacterium]
MLKINKVASSISPSLTLAITSKASALKAQGKDIISFGAGEPDFDTPDYIRASAIEAINKGITRYTAASGTMELKEAICKKLLEDNSLSYKPENIIISNGAKHSLYNIFAVLLEDGDEVIVPSPFWLSYPEMVKMAKGTPVMVETSAKNAFKITAEDFERAVTPKTKAIVINSPNNPTGSVYTYDELKAIGEVAVKYNIAIISDEIYEKIIYDGLNHVSIASISPEIKELTFVVNGMSKAYAMTGWRIGYVAGPAYVIKAMSAMQSHATSNPNSIAQYASCTALGGDKDAMENMRATFEARRDLMVKEINTSDMISCEKPHGAFYVLVNISKLIGKSVDGKVIENSLDCSNILLDKALVATIPGVVFGLNDYIRLSYAVSNEHIVEGIARIRAFAESLK